MPALTKQAPAGEEAEPDIADGDGDAPSGIALFPPPGTDPIKQGIVVPEDFELPQGYVRHHQVTDDGKRLPAILMFHPDYNPTDEQGNPLSLPADRVVPADMAPPGLAIEMLDVPDTVVPQIEERDDSAARETAPQH